MTLAQLGLQNSDIKLFFDTNQVPYHNYYNHLPQPSLVVTNPHSIGVSVNQVTPVDIYGSTVTPIITNLSAPMPNFPGMNSNAPVNKVTITSNPTGVSSG